jgi:ribulose kinase
MKFLVKNTHTGQYLTGRCGSVRWTWKKEEASVCDRYIETDDLKLSLPIQSQNNPKIITVDESDSLITPGMAQALNLYHSKSVQPDPA